MNKEELEYQLEKSQVEIASLKLRIKTIKRRRKQESAKRRLLQQRINKAIEYINKNKENRKGLSVSDYKEKWRSLFDYYESEEIMRDILSILRGEDNE